MYISARRKRIWNGVVQFSRLAGTALLVCTIAVLLLRFGESKPRSDTRSVRATTPATTKLADSLLVEQKSSKSVFEDLDRRPVRTETYRKPKEAALPDKPDKEKQASVHLAKQAPMQQHYSYKQRRGRAALAQSTDQRHQPW